MAKEEIIKKLDEFLKDKKPLNEECHIVYLMVEIRKILYHENNHKYPILHFYCDWIVHIEKDKITDEIRTIMEEIFKDIKIQIENPALTKTMSKAMQFAYMEDLKIDMQSFLKTHQIETNLFEDKNWIQFISILVNVLENQPINNPTDDITRFSFLPSASRCVQGIVVFKKPIKEYSHYKFSNAY